MGSPTRNMGTLPIFPSRLREILWVHGDDGRRRRRIEPIGHFRYKNVDSPFALVTKLHLVMPLSWQLGCLFVL
jgi:hypothetical protein